MSSDRIHASARRLSCPLSDTLWQEIEKRCRERGESLEHLVQAALADYLQVDHATLFQVSTAGALVEGVYRGEVTIAGLREHGDFGLGTFNGLDGEMVVLDGHFFQVRADGTVNEVNDDVRTPYAMVIRFPEGPVEALSHCSDFAGLCKQLDRLRDSQNVFYAIRIDGAFSVVSTRSVRPTQEGVPLVEAAAGQKEFNLKEIRGTLIGFWSPGYLKEILVAGYHLHFLSEDRQAGGHLLDAIAQPGLKAQVRRIADFRVSLPETTRFLQADLTRSPTEDLDRAEKKSH